MLRKFFIAVGSVLLFGCSSNIDKWIPLSFEKNYFSLNIQGVDLKIPRYTQTGDAKFISEGDTIYLGYKVEYVFDPLDLTLVPKRYLNERIVKTPSGSFTQQPIRSVLIEAKMTFTLKDKDGFVVREASSEPFALQSGENGNVRKTLVQGTLLYFFAREEVERTKRMEVLVSELRCLSCDDGVVK